LPNKDIAMNLIDAIVASIPKASYFIVDAPETTYGLTPLYFTPRPDSICRALFTQDQIGGHLKDLMNQQ
jgi:hypothetical protein